MSTIDFVKTDCGDLSCHIGITFLADILVMNSCTDAIADLAGYTAELVIYAIGELTDIDTITGTIDIAKGIISFEILAADTDDYEIGMYNYQINITQGSNVFRLSDGKFEVTR